MQQPDGAGAQSHADGRPTGQGGLPGGRVQLGRGARRDRRALVGAAAGLTGATWLAACGLAQQGGALGRSSKGQVTLSIASPGDAAVQTDKWKPLLAAWRQRFPEVQSAQDIAGASMPLYNDKLVVVFASGGSYDALQMHWTVVGDIMTRGWMQPLDALIAKDRSVNMADFPPYVV